MLANMKNSAGRKSCRKTIGMPLKTRPLTRPAYKAKFGRNTGVTKRNAAVRASMNNDKNLFRTLARYAVANSQVALFQVPPNTPFPVWYKVEEQFSRQNNGKKLGKWRERTEFFKLMLCSQVILEYKGYAFTVKINSALEEIWRIDGADIYNCVKRRIRNALVAHGLSDVGLTYVIEGKSPKGSLTRLHIHGMVCGIDQSDLRAFKEAMETALEVGSRRRGKGSGLDFQSILYYDEIERGQADESAKWPNYCSKALMTKDPRLPGQRTFMNRRLLEMTKKLWGVITDAPPGKE
jgi:hypothetical protein